MQALTDASHQNATVYEYTHPNGFMAETHVDVSNDDKITLHIHTHSWYSLARAYQLGLIAVFL